MKRLLFFTVMMMVLFLAACSGNNDNTENKEANLNEEKDIETMAEDLFAHFVNGEYEEVVQYFDETMTDALTVEDLEEVDDLLSDQLGEFIDSEYAQTDQADGVDIVVLHATYEVADINVIVTFNDKKEVAGFFFQ